MNFFSPNIKLLRKRRMRTQEDLAFALQLKRTTINSLENRISKPSIEQLQAFSKYYNFAIDTLINIDVAQLSESQLYTLENGADVFIRGTKLRVLAASVTPDNEDTIELVSEKAKAGYTNSYADPEYIAKLSVFQLPFLSKNKKYRAFPIEGDSMLPIPEGAIIVGEYIQNFYDIVSGKAYIVLTMEEGIVFKIIEHMDNKKGELTLKSLNRQYKPYTIPISDVREIWKFSLFLNFDLPESTPEYNDIMYSLNELKGDVREIKGKL
ncbi:MAG: helix-turn-helix domain-containing protein [Salinivirgaceae bacterium]|jgi:transcriptional regulator with XRE-family HTH domain|nr:helix-turn-helix domain-containing protein [Salinivirgaceae bacterium]